MAKQTLRKQNENDKIILKERKTSLRKNRLSKKYL